MAPEIEALVEPAEVPLKIRRTDDKGPDVEKVALNVTRAADIDAATILLTLGLFQGPCDNKKNAETSALVNKI